MENNTPENINGLSENQEAMRAKIDKINEILAEEPQARIISTLKVTEFGIFPSDPKLMPVQKNEESGDTEPSDEEEGTEPGGDSEGEPTGEQPSEA